MTIEGANAAGLQIHEQVIEVLLAALKEHEKAKGIEEEFLKNLCIEAIEEDRINDLLWLETRLDQLQNSPNKAVPHKEQWEEVLARIEPSSISKVETESDLHEVLRIHEVWMSSVLDPKRDVSGGRANLQGACLQGFDLRFLNLSCADLRHANLMGANLEGANFTSAKLQSANLQGANLSNTKFRRANLTNADLRDADYETSDFRNAIMTGTILEGKISIDKPNENKKNIPSKIEF